jgi:hypothetical protein
MSAWLLLLILAIVAFIIGFGTAAYWLFIVAVVLLLIAAFSGYSGRGGGTVV